MELAEPDFELFPPGQQMPIQQYLVDLQGIVAAGPAAFDEAANATLLGGAVEVVSALTEVTCDAFIR